MKNKPPQKRLSVFHSDFREDLRYWVKTDRKIALHILELIESIMRNPTEGIGQILLFINIIK